MLAAGAAPSVDTVVLRLGRRFRVRGMLPWGHSIPFFRADSDLGPLVIAALPFECPPESKAEAAFQRLAQRLSSVTSRGLPVLVRHGLEDGVPYLAFRQPQGRLLSEVLAEQGRCPRARCSASERRSSRPSAPPIASAWCTASSAPSASSSTTAAATCT